MRRTCKRCVRALDVTEPLWYAGGEKKTSSFVALTTYSCTAVGARGTCMGVASTAVPVVPSPSARRLEG